MPLWQPGTQVWLGGLATFSDRTPSEKLWQQCPARRQLPQLTGIGVNFLLPCFTPADFKMASF